MIRILKVKVRTLKAKVKIRKAKVRTRNEMEKVTTEPVVGFMAPGPRRNSVYAVGTDPINTSLILQRNAKRHGEEGAYARAGGRRRRGRLGG